MTAEIIEDRHHEAALALDKVKRFEAHLAQLPQRLDVITEHVFAPGLCMRRMVLPAGTVATGAAHKFEHLSIMVSGDITVLTDEGPKRLSGYHEWASPPGVKRVGITHADTVWLTVHATQATTVDEFEAEQFEQADELLSRKILAIKAQEPACLP